MSETQMMNVEMSSSGSKKLRYWAVAGANYVDAGGNVHIYLGTEADTTTWARFERNVVQDWEGVATGVTWSNTDALAVMPMSAYNYDLSIDEIRLSDGRTVEFNSLTGGGIGQIASVRKHDGVRILPLPLASAEVELYYNGMCNRTLWPLYHDAIITPAFSRQ